MSKLKSLFRIVCINLFLIFTLLSCSSNNTPSDLGSASFSLTFPDSQLLQQMGVSRATNINCTSLGISTVDVDVYDSANTYLTGDEFACSAGSGTVYNIPPGNDRKFVVLATDGSGNTLYRGETTGVSIENGKNTDVGTVDAIAFVSDLVLPLNDSQVTNTAVLLQWSDVPGGTQYRLIVSTDPTFQSGISIDTYVTGTTYSLQGPASAGYYWKVIPRDFDNHDGSESETWYFTVTSDGPSVNIETPSNNSIFNEGDTISFSGTGTDDIDGNLTGSDLVWVSSLDNQIGLGNSFTTGLSVGTHTITLTGTDSDNIVGITSINISVQAAWYKDADGDLYSDGTMVTASSSPGVEYFKASDLTVTFGDCDDTSASVNPGMEEVCLDSIDNDCNPGTDDACDLDGDGVLDDEDLCPDTESGQTVDEYGCSASQTPIWYNDVDKDGYGDPEDQVQTVSQPAGYVSDNTDCDDGSNSVHPGAVEILDDNIDQNCDGADLKTWYADIDGDGYGNNASSTTANTQPSGYVADNTDCNDNNAGSYPGLSEILDDGIDQDCDGADLKTWYADTDTDGFGDPNSSLNSNTQPVAYVSDNTDCDDTEIDVNPDIVEICGDGIDQNCDNDDPVCTIVNSLGMTFNYIPEGTFMMGSPADELGRSDNEVQHQVTLTQPFYMQTTEVTQGQWQTVMGNNPSNYTACGSNCPVEMVSWYDVQDFLSEIYLIGEGTYRLPTEAEWEYSARAESTSAFAIGDITETVCDFDPILDLIGWYCNNGDSTTHPVAQKGPNDWGLFDMHGNVNEWVQDWGTFDLGQTPVVDPEGPSIGDERIIRSGSFNEDARNSRSAYRHSWLPYGKDSTGGFRLALISGSDKIPVILENLTATSGNGQVILSWKPNPIATIYNCYMHTTSNVTKAVYSSKDVTSTNSYTWVNLTNDTSYYFIVTAENSVGESDDSVVKSATPYDTGNSPPTLSNISALPSPGTNLDSFTFSVDYFDLDGDPPQTRLVYIDEIPYSMGYYSGTFSNGTYNYQTRLVEGSHTYRFEFSDGDGNLSRLPSTGNYNGPDVTSASVTVTGKILKDGVPVPGINMQFTGQDEQNQNNVYLSLESITDSQGVYTFSFEYVPDILYHISNDRSYEAPDAFWWWWQTYHGGIQSELIIMPDLDIYYNELYSPSDNTTFTADEINDSNPIIFQWSDVGNENIQRYHFYLHDEYGSYIFADGDTIGLSTSYAFNGILDSGERITPGNYTWRVICVFSLVGDGWAAQTKEKPIILE